MTENYKGKPSSGCLAPKRFVNIHSHDGFS